jgi:hypothetical protein
MRSRTGHKIANIFCEGGNKVLIGAMPLPADGRLNIFWTRSSLHSSSDSTAAIHYTSIPFVSTLARGNYAMRTARLFSTSCRRLRQAFFEEYTPPITNRTAKRMRKEVSYQLPEVHTAFKKDMLFFAEVSGNTYTPRKACLINLCRVYGCQRRRAPGKHRLWRT